MSDLLEKCGFDSEQINTIRSRHLELFISSLTEMLKVRMTEFSDDQRSQDILFRRFGIDGNLPESLRDIAWGYALSGERIRQLEKKALRGCRHKANLQIMETNLRELAQTYSDKKD